MKELIRVFVVALALASMSGCAAFSVEGDPACDLTAESHRGSETVHGSIWGWTWGSRDVEKCQNDLGIARVEYHTNAGFLLVSVASLGLYVPQNVEWWCEAPCPEADGELLNSSDMTGDTDQ